MAIANTQSLATNFFIDPYYDDFNESKNFHRILFRPGQAVQARELTQMQTMLQNQVDRFAEHIFQEGSVVRGIDLQYNKYADYVQLMDQDQLGNTVVVTDFSNTSVSATSGVSANVVIVKDGSESATVKKTLYVTYTAVGTNGTTTTFANGNLLTFGNGKTANVITSSTSTGKGSLVRLGAGIIYAKDHFIRVDEQTIVVGDYSANTTKRVGYDISETIVTSADDSTLLDPAQGSFNYTAPGANRLKLTATLAVKDPADTSTANFIEILRIKNGNIEQKSDKPSYSQINDYIARRTFAESGHYIVNGLNLKLREHLNQSNNQGVFTAAEGGDANKLSVDVKPGQAYVFGYERDNLSTKHVAIDKGIDFNDISSASLTTNYGNYVNVDNVVGAWDINEHSRVSLRDEAMNPIANGNFSILNTVGNEIGTARVRSLDYTTGTKGGTDAQYKLYLYDIQMSNGAFTEVRSIQSAGTVASANGKADIIVSAANTAVLNETDFNIGVFELPASAVRRIRNSSGTVAQSYIFNQSFDVTISSAGTFTLTTNDSTERFQDTGAQSATQKNDNFYLVLNGTATSASGVDTGSMSDGANTVTGLTAASTKFNVGETIALAGHGNTFVISSVGSTSLTTFQSAQAAISSQAVTKVLPAGTVIDLAGVGGDASARTVNVTTDTTADFDIQETFTAGVSATVHVKLNRTSAREKSKTFNSNRYVMIDTSSNAGGVTGPWNLGIADVFAIKEVRVKSSRFTGLAEGTDVTSDFTFDNGQRDNLYSLASLLKKTNSSLSITSGDHLLIKLDFFSENTAQGSGYYSVDSYPIDDTNTANTTAITTAEIPVYISPISGQEFKLRDCIDVRPRITDTANNTTSLTSITTDPANTYTVLEGTGDGLRYASPNENFAMDLSYYLPRVDRIVIDKEGRFRSITGTSAKNAITPETPADSFTIGTIRVAPYPSTIAGFEYLPGANTTENSFAIEERVTRYTMKDIGTLATRINNLEYYSSLNLLEQSTESLNITDGAGLNRFKSGFLVDNFVDRAIADTTNEDYKTFIDTYNKEAGPRDYTTFTKLNYVSGSSTNVTRSSGDIRITVGASTAFSNGETISSGAASGTLRYVVGDRLYIEDITGTFPTSGTVTGGSSGLSATISSVKTYPDGKLITLPYSHDLIIDASQASGTRNAAGVAYTWEGILTLTPDQDFFVDTVNLPPNRRTVDIDVGTRDGGVVGDPATPWAQQLINAGRTNLPFRRNEQRTNVRNQTVTTNTIVESSQPIPFIRAQTIQFTAKGLKPNAVVYPFFDDVAVSSYVRPANSSFANTGGAGTTLQAAANGTLYGLFDLPNNSAQRFETGTSTFRVIDNINNVKELGTFVTSAESNFTATGTRQFIRDTIVTTREIETVNVRVLYDPLGQSFRIEDSINDSSTNIRQNPSDSPGMFLTKLDLFFATKDTTLPVEIQIREIDPSSGFITPRIVPFGKIILDPADINVNPTTPIPTPVYFDTPIYLLTDVDYAIVIKPGGGSPEYNMFIARMGETDIITGNRIVANPYSGLLFISANDRNWKSVQEEDVTFKAYFANFGVGQTGTVAVTNEASEYFNISTSNTSSLLARGQTVHGETTLVLKSTPTANVGEVIVGATSGAEGTITSIASNTHIVKDVTLAAKFANNEVVNFQFANGQSTGANASIFSTSTPTGVIDFINRNEVEGGRMTITSPTGTFAANSQFKEQVSGYTGVIDSVTTLKADEAVVKFGILDLDNTVTTVTGKMATSTTTRDASFNSFTKNGVTYLDSRKQILGSNQETAGLAGAKSGDFRLALSNSTNNRHSPAIDVDRIGVLTSEFFINNLDTNETSNRGGDATTRYISKVVTLADGLDAEDMRVLLTAYKPSVANIKVYAKFLNASDSETIADRPWEELSKTTLSTVHSADEDKSDLIELEYNLPSSVLTGSGGEYQYTSSSVTYTGYKYFALKIVMLTSNTAKAPKVIDLRAIALQV